MLQWIPCCSDVLPPLRILGILYSGSGDESHGGFAGASGEAGVKECSGDLQPRPLLHVPCRGEALPWNGREPDCVRAGPRPQREEDEQDDKDELTRRQNGGGAREEEPTPPRTSAMNAVPLPPPDVKGMSWDYFFMVENMAGTMLTEEYEIKGEKNEDEGEELGALGLPILALNLGLS